MDERDTVKITYRKKTRELLMRIVFQMASTSDFSDEAKQAYLADTSLYLGNVQEEVPPGCIFDEPAGECPDFAYLNWAFSCLKDHLPEIDSTISAASEGWSVQRIGATELAILRVAATEIMFIEDIDIGVSVNEAVLMAKRYASEKSASFINGVLGTIARQKKGIPA